MFFTVIGNDYFGIVLEQESLFVSFVRYGIYEKSIEITAKLDLEYLVATKIAFHSMKIEKGVYCIYL